MDGRNTIIITLKCYFHVSDSDVGRFNSVCDLLLSGLIGEVDEKTPSYYRIKTAINTMARCFSSDNQNTLLTIEADLWTMIVNWWDTVKWARRGIRIPMETDDFIADLLANIVSEIMADPTTKPYYKPAVLEALLQMNEPSRRTTRYANKRLSRDGNLNEALKYYQQLSENYGFGTEYPILLRLLLCKLARNAKRHLDFLIPAYRTRCEQIKITPSYHDYISRRALAISPEFSDHCERLFKEQL